MLRLKLFCLSSMVYLFSYLFFYINVTNSDAFRNSTFSLADYVISHCTAGSADSSSLPQFNLTRFVRGFVLAFAFRHFVLLFLVLHSLPLWRIGVNPMTNYIFTTICININTSFTLSAAVL